jgi:hypothetical protein
MNEFVFKPPLLLARGARVRTIDDAAEFARRYVGGKWGRRRERVVRRLEAASGLESKRDAANDFRAWAEAEGLLRHEN